MPNRAAQVCRPAAPNASCQRRKRGGGDMGRALRIRELDEAAEYPFDRAQLVPRGSAKKARMARFFGSSGANQQGLPQPYLDGDRPMIELPVVIAFSSTNENPPIRTVSPGCNYRRTVPWSVSILTAPVAALLSPHTFEAWWTPFAAARGGRHLRGSLAVRRPFSTVSLTAR